MVIYVLDSSAILRFLDGEAGFEIVREIFRLALRGQARILICAVNWGEVAGKLRKRLGPEAAQAPLRRILQKGLEVVPASAERASASAAVAADYGISYADTFGVQLTAESADRILVTADYGVKAVEPLIKIEFLPVKPPA